MKRAVMFLIAVGILMIPSAGFAQQANQDAQQDAAAKEFQAIQEGIAKATTAFMEKYNAAANDEERAALMSEYPPYQAAGKYLDLAKKYPDSEITIAALTMAMQYAQDPELAEQAVEILITKHIDSPQIASIVQSWVYDPTKADTMRRILGANEDRNVKAMTTYALGKLLLNTGGDDEAVQSECQSLLETVVSDFGDVPYRGQTLADVAKRDLFEATHLMTGMEAPEIEGDDVDEVDFKLSDYRGKVVMLDFWGDW